MFFLPIQGILKGTNALGQNERGIDSNEGVINTPQISFI